MAKVTGFLEHDRAESESLAPKKRLKNFEEFVLPFPEKTLNEQASRCMDCGIPYCHDSCPINNIIPDNTIIAKPMKIAVKYTCFILSYLNAPKFWPAIEITAVFKPITGKENKCSNLTAAP